MASPETSGPSLPRIGGLLLSAMLLFTVIHWIGRPLERKGIEPVALNHRINVNTADAATLGLLSGVSGKISGYLIEERATNGPFRSPEDLGRVRWIGPVTIQKAAPFISFDLPAATR